ncbi:hypothetical protein Sjap_017421 [Stephania japonica]|uniref:Agglutinin domain-containing protein n=1 Tax=Stephania japonica TaxID=461633 RepID=A0AAP0NLZ1_9MAGN
MENPISTKSPDDYLIAAATETIEEDTTKWSCTLFEPINVVQDGEGNYDLSLRHAHDAQHQYRVVIQPWSHNVFLHLKRGVRFNPTKFKVLEWNKFVIFPKYVAFKGDNDCYLSAKTIEEKPYLQFASKGVADPTVGQEVFLNRDGTIRIKSNHFGKFWRCSVNWIWCDASDAQSHHKDCLFQPVKLDGNVVALRNLGNNNYCQRLTTEGKTDCLNTAVRNIYNEARLEIGELVFSRKIHNLEFRVDKAKVDIEQVILAMSNKVENVPEGRDAKSEVKMTYEVQKSSTWKASASLSLGVTTTFETSIPLVTSGKIEISTQLTKSYEWGKTKASSVKVEASTEVIVPPKSKRRVIVVATKGLCNLPFSYYQTDLLTNGRYVNVQKHDGMYTGVNYYDISSIIVNDEGLDASGANYYDIVTKKISVGDNGDD